MLRILTSLTFLYAFAILVLLVYGFFYYRDFTKGRYQRGRFPLVFFLISLSCTGFIWINIHAPLSLKTFSNLDHHFIRHDGFAVSGSIELGRSDTLNNSSLSYNRFLFAKQQGIVLVSSVYADEPFYINTENGYQIASINYPATGHALSFRAGGLAVTIRQPTENSFELSVDETVFRKELTIKKGITAWNIFREDEAFINTEQYNNSHLVNALKNILLIRDNVARKKFGELKFFLAGHVFSYAELIEYNGQKITPGTQQFNKTVPDRSMIAWGIGFLDNNRNQLQVNYAGKDSFSLINRYPTAYPLSEEQRNDWGEHRVSKFLVSDGRDLQRMPAVFKEGFLFSAYNQDSATHFSPVLLSYRKAARNESLDIHITGTGKKQQSIDLTDERFVLAGTKPGVNWIFSVSNTYQWDFASFSLSARSWQALLFGSLGFFFILIFFTAINKPAAQLSWVWQVLACIVMVLLTTRFFLYWRYKSFPPYEGMDLPSQQQLNSIGNFGIILFAAIVLALLFGYGFLRQAYVFCRIQLARLFKKPYYNLHTQPDEGFPLLNKLAKRLPLIKQVGIKAWFFASWFALLAAAGFFAGLNHFDPGVCRHLAIVFIVIYFIYLFISYRYSPLVAVAGENWWRLGTGRSLDIIISNPVKILLSVSLLALFVFIDIGFAIVFLNFLLFNEAFLCINYGIAGLSAGSRKNAALFGGLGVFYLLFFVVNLLYAPYIFKFLLALPPFMYIVGYLLFAVSIAYVILRLLVQVPVRTRRLAGMLSAVLFFAVAFFFFPKERILDKAAMTRYRIDVLTTPVDKAIGAAYEDGKTYEPVIRAAQNQWFINTFIDEVNNPAVQYPGFTLLPHAPQNKGAKYNAQATDLVASRFLVGEHGKWAVLLYVLLLLLPVTMLASFYKLYPDFTNRINTNYPGITAGFSVLNYILITALMVILAATGRYIFFGQDLPFGSILSKQSILFPCILILAVILFFRNIPLEHYANRKKIVPGVMVFSLLILLLFFVRPSFNRNREFAVADLAKEMEAFVQQNVQPLFDHFDTAAHTRRFSMAKKDQLFSDSLRRMLESGLLNSNNKFFTSEISQYAYSGYSRHLDKRRLLYLDLSSGIPDLAVNNNYFRVEPPPHLQQTWTGDVLGDTLTYGITWWNGKDGSLINKRVSGYTKQPQQSLANGLVLSFREPLQGNLFTQLYLVNTSGSSLQLKYAGSNQSLAAGDSLRLRNPMRVVITTTDNTREEILTIEPDAFMRNYYVNGSRYYVYPMAERFTWARNFAEAIASDHTTEGEVGKNVFVSFDFALMDSLSLKIRDMMARDTSYKKGAEYGICIADGNGRIVAMTDYINGLRRPDPNDKAGFAKAINGEEGFVAQSLLRKQIGNINLLRLNPGPGSTLKPIVFSAIASQLAVNWDNFASRGFTEKQNYFAGMKVPEYDFENDNGRISKVTDYLKYSDNYYHSNVLLLGSYPKQESAKMLASHFTTTKPGEGLRWPWFSYNGKDYWMDGFANWPAYVEGAADFGSDSSFTSIGLLNNYGIHTKPVAQGFSMFGSAYDSLLFGDAFRQSGFILPETSIFDQRGETVNHRNAYDLFTSCFRGHVKGSSQVLMAPIKMVEASGKMISQSRNYSLTLDPYAAPSLFSPFYVDNSISYNAYLSLVREGVFGGMREALFGGTAARLGRMLKNGAPYYYYGKTGTTGDDAVKAKSKLFSLIISAKDITDPGFNFRDNKFYTIYFTSQNGPAKQNEEFQAAIVKYLQESERFNRYMTGNK